VRVGLFIPCYVDQLYPEVGLATVRVLERFGVRHHFPQEQTCCGQPMANTGCARDAAPLAEKLVRVFRGYEYVVCPSGSCVAMVRHHYHEYLAADPDYRRVRARTYELCEFLVDVLGVETIEGRFPWRVGLHQSCQGLRGLRLASSSELVGEPFNKVRALLGGIDGIELCDLDRPDECCGFGGTFAVTEEAVSCMMGRDRIADHVRAGTEVLTGVDMSCLMHMSGLARRDGVELRVMHVVEILDECGARA
jgi:L-lactate dehydrogenase complex protein LldE